MRSRIVLVVTLGVVLLLASAAAAQQSVPATPAPAKRFTPASEVEQFIKKAAAERGAAQANYIQVLLRLPCCVTVNLEYRVGPQIAAVHDVDAETFHVLRGSGVLVTGGKLVSPVQVDANSTGPGIEGGTSQTVTEGDYFAVPPGAPHWFANVNGFLVLESTHIAKPPTPAPPPAK